MKLLLRTYLIHLLALWLTTFVFSGSFTIYGGLASYLIAALILTILNLLLKPLLKLLFFPVNLLTLGLFSLIINAATFYLFLKLSPQVRISAWYFPGFSFNEFHLVGYQLNFLETLLAISISVSLMTNILMFFFK